MSTFTLAFKYFFIDLFGDIIRWPIWWYTRGLVLVLKKSGESIGHYYSAIGLGVWIKNLFVPMYGLRDWQGRLISFFVRIVQIVFRIIFVAAWLVIVFIGVIAYIAIPLITFLAIFINFGRLLV